VTGLGATCILSSPVTNSSTHCWFLPACQSYWYTAVPLLLSAASSTLPLFFEMIFQVLSVNRSKPHFWQSLFNQFHCITLPPLSLLHFSTSSTSPLCRCARRKYPSEVGSTCQRWQSCPFQSHCCMELPAA